MFSHILLPTDGSDCAHKAALTAATIAGAFSSRVTVLNVFKPTTYFGVFEAPTDIGPDEKCIKAIQDEAINSATEVMTGRHVEFDTRREIGLPSDEIVRIAEQEHCDLIVLGSRGHSGIRSLVLGSTCDQVSHQAHCPVLIVK